MSFVESNLMDGEEVVYRAKLHWCIFIKPMIALIFAIIYPNIFQVLYGVLPYFPTNLFYYLRTFQPIILLIAIIYFIFIFVDYKTTEIFITNKRISRKKGIISRVSLDIKLSMIETVIFSQRIIGRIFNYGHVYFNGVGAMAQKFRGIYNPLGLRNIIIKKIHDGESTNESIINKTIKKEKTWTKNILFPSH
jgi:hypothetical protein